MHERTFLAGKRRRRSLDYFLIQFFGVFCVKEIGESLRVWRCHFNVLKIFLSRLSISGTKGSFVTLLLIS